MNTTCAYPLARIYYNRPLPIGMRMGTLTVIGTKYYACIAAPICRCDCGRIVFVRNVLFWSDYRPCDCALLERLTIDGLTSISLADYSHHHTNGVSSLCTHHDSQTRIYRIWRGMVGRCNNPKHAAYKYYGARGIRVCAEWSLCYHDFKIWAVHHGYRDDLSIDRIDNDGNYEPSNCRWTTMREQIHNRRPYKRHKN